jgi:hypothetical protein
MSAPQAEMSTAGVIIAVRTATAEESASIVSFACSGSGALIMRADGGRGQPPRDFLVAAAKVLVHAGASCAILRRKADKRSSAH